MSLLFGIFLSLISIVTSIGNFIVILAFSSDKKLRTINDYLLLNMAIADFLVGIFCIPFYIPFSLKGSWPFGRLFCQIWVTIDDVSTMASVINIVAISANRYWSIAYPISYRKYAKKQFLNIILISIWTFSFMNFAPGIWLMNFFDGNSFNPLNCSGDYNRSFVYMLIAQFNYFIWPFILLCILNLLIISNIWKRTKKITKQRISSRLNSTTVLLHNTKSIPKLQKEKNQSSSPENVSEMIPRSICLSLNNLEKQVNIRLSTEEQYSPMIVKHSLDNSSIRTSKEFRSSSPVILSEEVCQINEKILKEISKLEKKKMKRDLRIVRDRKSARSLFILVFVFLIFLFPYVICSIISTAGFHISSTLFQISFSLLWINSTLNPFIYPFIQMKYRRAYIQLFKSLFLNISSNQLFTNQSNRVN